MHRQKGNQSLTPQRQLRDLAVRLEPKAVQQREIGPTLRRRSRESCRWSDQSRAPIPIACVIWWSSIMRESSHQDHVPAESRRPSPHYPTPTSPPRLHTVAALRRRVPAKEHGVKGSTLLLERLRIPARAESVHKLKLTPAQPRWSLGCKVHSESWPNRAGGLSDAVGS